MAMEYEIFTSETFDSKTIADIMGCGQNMTITSTGDIIINYTDEVLTIEFQSHIGEVNNFVLILNSSVP